MSKKASKTLAYIYIYICVCVSHVNVLNYKQRVSKVTQTLGSRILNTSITPLEGYQAHQAHGGPPRPRATRPTKIHAHIHKYIHTHIPTYLPTDRPTDRPTYLPTYLQTYKYIHENTHSFTCFLCFFWVNEYTSKPLYGCFVFVDTCRHTYQGTSLSCICYDLFVGVNSMTLIFIFRYAYMVGDLRRGSRPALGAVGKADRQGSRLMRRAKDIFHHAAVGALPWSASAWYWANLNLEPSLGSRLKLRNQAVPDVRMEPVYV